MAKDFKVKLEEIRTKLPGLFKRIPDVIKVEGLEFIHDNFDNQGFEKAPGATNKWAPRKASKNKKVQAKSEGRSILVKRGALRRSWEQDTTASPTQVAFTSSLPYAEVHNEGGKAGRGSGFTMPQRQMIGPSAELDKRIGEKLDELMDSLFKD